MRRTDPSPSAKRVHIGCAFIPRQRITHGADAIRLQAALLDQRTAKPLSGIRRVLAPIVSWL